METRRGDIVLQAKLLFGRIDFEIESSYKKVFLQPNKQKDKQQPKYLHLNLSDDKGHTAL